MSFPGTSPISPASAERRIDQILGGMQLPVFSWGWEEHTDSEGEQWVTEPMRVDHAAPPELPTWVREVMTSAATRASEVADVTATARYLDWQAAKSGSESYTPAAPLSDLEAFWRESRPGGMTDEMIEARLRGAIAVRFFEQDLSAHPEVTSLDRSIMRVGGVVTRILAQAGEVSFAQPDAPQAAA